MRFHLQRAWYWVALLVLGAAPLGAWASANYSAVILADIPIGYWPLAESSTNSIAVDLSVTGWNGIYSRGVTSGVPGAINNGPDTAAQLDISP
jgi:hypothetical protein